MATDVLDQTRVDAFGEKMVDVLNYAALALMTSIGHRSGLFDTMAEMEPATSAEIAARAGLSERYVREWLGAMTTGGVVEYKAETGQYWLPPEHAAWLTRAATPNNMAANTQWFSVLGGVEDKVLEAFRHGKGVPYSAYHRFTEVMAEESAQTVVSGLREHILPLAPGLIERLEAGIDVLDIGCGSGRALIRMAEEFPKSRFVGHDISEEGVQAGRAEARRLGLSNVTFEVRDVSVPEPVEAFDLVTAFDAIHDQAKPAAVLENIWKALRPDGVFLMQDIMASSHLQHNLGGQFATLIYTISCMHCMSVSLANGGPGLGAAWGKEKALEMLREAGFEKVTVKTLPHDPLNYYYISER